MFEDFVKIAAEPSINFLRQAIYSAKPMKSLNNEIPSTIDVPGLPATFSDSQRKAVRMALKERLSIIQGPPGTGKTQVVAALVANWMKNKEDTPKVLICAPSNNAADFIAERLQQIPSL